VRQSIYGRPGATYLDFPDDLITGSCDTDTVAEVQKCPDPPRTMAMPQDIERALDVLQSGAAPACPYRPGHGVLARRGRGCALYRAHADTVRAHPKAKGVLPDDHPLSAGAARSLALLEADVVFLMARASTGSCISACRRATTRMFG